MHSISLDFVLDMLGPALEKKKKKNCTWVLYPLFSLELLDNPRIDKLNAQPTRNSHAVTNFPPHNGTDQARSVRTERTAPPDRAD